uniref:GH01083p n=1 Tax=Drosophila melanogaster TaxID=7227 RepID=Q95TD3_DROME|nr:GH01083p [Drosophila melanogaster]
MRFSLRDSNLLINVTRSKTHTKSSNKRQPDAQMNKKKKNRDTQQLGRRISGRRRHGCRAVLLRT